MRQPCAANSSGELRSGSATMNEPVAMRVYADIVYSTVRVLQLTVVVSYVYGSRWSMMPSPYEACSQRPWHVRAFSFTVWCWFFSDPETDTQKTRNYRNSVVGGNRFWRRTKKPDERGEKTMLCGNQSETISPCTAGTETRPYFAKVVYPHRQISHVVRDKLYQYCNIYCYYIAYGDTKCPRLCHNTKQTLIYMATLSITVSLQ